MGKIRGPRIWSAGRALGPRPYAWGLEGGRGFRGNIEFKTPEEGRTIVRKKKDIGIDIIKLNEFLTPELVRAIIEEAHHLGLPVTGHSLDVVSYARAGVDGIEHQWSVGYSSISNLNKRKRLVEQKLLGHIGQEELPFFYDTNNFDKIIDAMVENGVSWSPTIATWWRPLSPSASAFRKRELSILNNPDAKYLPPALRAITLGQYEKFKRWPPEKLNRVKEGFEKIQKFMRRFVKAGGIIKAGSDPNAGIPALLVHQELKMYVEAGLTPMQAIQAATINVAKTFKKDMDFGTVQPGKVADLIVVDGNPLKDIWAAQNVKMVIMNGQVIDIKFHANHENPIPSPDPWRAIPREIEIFPPAIAERSGPALLKVKPKTGGFDSFHKVTFNGTELETRFVNKNELQAVIPPRVIKKAGVYPIAVVNPGDFGGRSYSTHLIVTFVSEKAGKPNSLLVKVGKNARS